MAGYAHLGDAVASVTMLESLQKWSQAVQGPGAGRLPAPPGLLTARAAAETQQAAPWAAHPLVTPAPDARSQPNIEEHAASVGCRPGPAGSPRTPHAPRCWAAIERPGRALPGDALPKALPVGFPLQRGRSAARAGRADGRRRVPAPPGTTSAATLALSRWRRRRPGARSLPWPGVLHRACLAFAVLHVGHGITRGTQTYALTYRHCSADSRRGVWRRSLRTGRTGVC